MEVKNIVAQKNGRLSKILINDIEELSFSAFSKALRQKDVKVNGLRVNTDVNVCKGDQIAIYFTISKVSKYNLIYSDQNVVVIDKFSGYTSESVFDSVKRDYADARFIHRLDRNTSGIMVFALNDMAEKELLSGFKARLFTKKYIALVKGVPPKQQDLLSHYLIKDSKKGFVSVFPDKKPNSVNIKTAYKLIEKRKDTSLLEITLLTGKTHQIRAHLAYIGNPIVGDSKYGDFAFNSKFDYKSQCLSAVELTLLFSDSSELAYLDKKTFKVKPSF